MERAAAAVALQGIVDAAVAANRGRIGALLPVLQEFQGKLSYVPPDAVPMIARALNLSRAEVHGVMSFYHDFRAEPAGEHTVHGVEAVLPRSRFFTDLPQTITKYARRVDKTALSQTCQEPLSEQATHGLESFNRQEYFEAHELLEEVWNADHSPGRELYRAILQIAVAYLQIERGNYNGAIKMFLRVRQWIDPLPDQCRDVNIIKLRLDAQEVYQMLPMLGKERISEFDRALLKPVEFNESP